MELVATYNITDDKLKVWFSERLDEKLYERVRSVGLVWWPGRKCFAGKWNVYAEDLILELGGTVEDDDTPDDVEGRVERFAARASGAQQAAEASKAYLEERANTERRRENARNSIDKNLTKAEHYHRRVEASIRHAKMKADPGVIQRRLKGLEADRRKYEKNLGMFRTLLKLWMSPTLTHEKALKLANYTSYQIDIRFDAHPHCGAWNLLKDNLVPMQEVVNAMITQANLVIRQEERRLEHVLNRIIYENANLDASGGMEGLMATKGDPVEVGGAAKCGRNFGEWGEILKVTPNSIRIAAVENRYINPSEKLKRQGYLVKLDKVAEIMSKAKWQELKKNKVPA